MDEKEKEEKGFESFIEECWALHKDTYPEKDIDPDEFRQQGLLKWNVATSDKKIRFFDEDSNEKDCSEFVSENEVVNLSNCFVNFSRQMRPSVSLPGETVSKIMSDLFPQEIIIDSVFDRAFKS